MAEKRKAIEPKMISIRKDQYDRLLLIAKKEDRSLRGIIQRMLDMYEGMK